MTLKDSRIGDLFSSVKDAFGLFVQKSQKEISRFFQLNKKIDKGKAHSFSALQETYM
jgi:hypothetical protein